MTLFSYLQRGMCNVYRPKEAMLKKTRQHSLASWKILPSLQNILLHSFSHISVSLCTPKVWIIATSARFCLVSLPTRLLGGKSRSGRKNGAVAAKITEHGAQSTVVVEALLQNCGVQRRAKARSTTGRGVGAADKVSICMWACGHV